MNRWAKGLTRVLKGWYYIKRIRVGHVVSDCVMKQEYVGMFRKD